MCSLTVQVPVYIQTCSCPVVADLERGCANPYSMHCLRPHRLCAIVSIVFNTCSFWINCQHWCLTSTYVCLLHAVVACNLDGGDSHFTHLRQRLHNQFLNVSLASFDSVEGFLDFFFSLSVLFNLYEWSLCRRRRGSKLALTSELELLFAYL